jgi:uncharacterized protein YbjQ (UPF0145 family)
MGPKVSVSVRVALIAGSPWQMPGGLAAAAARRNGRGAHPGRAIYRGSTSPEPVMLVATTNDLPGYRITAHVGMVRGVTVRSRSVIGNVGGAIQSIFGGNLSIYTNLAETARQEAYDLLVEHARRAGADAVVAMRYDANEIMEGITEVLAYGTAVKVERL